MITEKQRTERMRGIGGSDAAAVCGLSKWTTPYQLWEQKLGLSETIPNQAMHWGSILEPLVRSEYERLTGRKVLLPQTIWSEKWPFALANIDGVTLDDRLVEIKTAARGDGWGEPGTDEIPEYYVLQIQHYMAVTGLEVCDIAVLIAGSDFRIYEVLADHELIDILMTREAEFWRHVEDKVPPSLMTMDDVRAKFPKHNGQMRRALGDDVAKLNALKKVNEQIKELQLEADFLQREICESIGDYDGLMTADEKPLVTWRAPKPGSKFDAKAFQASHPELYEKFCVESQGSRRFLVK